LDLPSLRKQAWGRSLGLAVALNLVLGPLLGGLLRFGAPPGWLSQDLAVGLVVMAAMPTTLNTGLVIAVHGRGNLELALLLTVGILLASMLSLPLTLPLLLPTARNLGLNSSQLLFQLLTQVLLPLALGQGLRAWRRPADGWLWIPSLGVALSVWLTLSRHEGALPQANWLLQALLVFAILRGTLFLAARRMASTLGLSQAQRRSFVVVASQKSVVLAVTLLAQMPAGMESHLGGAALFCVLYHLGQAFWDSAWAPRVEN
jgi:sodium/bile acid cotransporter 7